MVKQKKSDSKKQKKSNKKAFPFFTILISLLLLGGLYFWYWMDLSLQSMKGKSITTNLLEIKENLIEKSEKKDKNKKTKKNNTQSISYESRIEEAVKLIDNQYYSKATLELNKALKTNDEKIYPYWLLGEIYLRNNNPKKLENLISLLEKKFPKNPEALILRTRKSINEKKYSEVLALLEGIDNLPPELLFYQSALLTLQNDFEKSREIFVALQKFPIETDSEKIQKTSFDPNKISENLMKKIKGFNQSFEKIDGFKQDQNTHLFAELAKVLAENNEAGLAYSFADIATKENPQYTDAWILRGYSQFLQGQYKAAEKDLFHAYQLDPLRSETSYFLALTLTETNNQPKAILYFEKALEYDFEFPEAVRWKLVDMLIQQKKYTRALEIYQELIPLNTEPKKFIAVIHTTIKLMNNPQKALTFTEVLIKNKPKNTEALNLHAWVLIENKKFIEAKRTLDKTLKLDKENPKTYLNLGLYYESQEDLPKAKKNYQKSYELAKSNKETQEIADQATEKYNQILQKSHPKKTPKLPSSP